MVRRPSHMRRPNKIPKEELMDLIANICIELEIAGKSGLSMGELMTKVDGAKVASAYMLSYLELQTNKHIITLRSSSDMRIYLTNKYYEDKSRVSEYD